MLIVVDFNFVWWLFQIRGEVSEDIKSKLMESKAELGLIENQQNTVVTGGNSGIGF